MKPLKRVAWIGSSKANLLAFPTAIRAQAGYELFLVQCGLEPTDWKPISTIGPGVREIRLRNASGAFRVIYLAARTETIYVLHCFQKKSRQTPRDEIELAQQRLKKLPR